MRKILLFKQKKQLSFIAENQAVAGRGFPDDAFFLFFVEEKHWKFSIMRKIRKNIMFLAQKDAKKKLQLWELSFLFVSLQHQLTNDMNKKELIMSKIRDAVGSIIPNDGHVYLYGSRARNTANDNSDWDILVLLDKERIESADHDSIGYAITSLGWDLGEAMIPVLYTKKQWESYSFMPFYKNVEQDKLLIV